MAQSKFKTIGKRLASSIDWNTEPCNDFYKFACGNWKKYHTDRLFSEIYDDNFQKIKRLLAVPADVIKFKFKNCHSADLSFLKKEFGGMAKFRILTRKKRKNHCHISVRVTSNENMKPWKIRETIQLFLRRPKSNRFLPLNLLKIYNASSFGKMHKFHSDCLQSIREDGIGDIEGQKYFREITLKETIE